MAPLYSVRSSQIIPKSGELLHAGLLAFIKTEPPPVPEIPVTAEELDAWLDIHGRLERRGIKFSYPAPFRLVSKKTGEFVDVGDEYNQ